MRNIHRKSLVVNKDSANPLRRITEGSSVSQSLDASEYQKALGNLKATKVTIDENTLRQTHGRSSSLFIFQDI